jgi:hypothetical protein
MDRIQIAEYLANKVFNKELQTGFNIMLKNKQIYYKDDYGKLVESYKISPEDTFACFIFIERILKSYKDPNMYLFPLMGFNGASLLTESYLFKLGFYNPNVVYPATGLKYYGEVILFSDRLVIELTDVDTIATNTGLRKIVMNMLGKSMLTQKEVSLVEELQIQSKLEEQKLFAGHNWKEAYEIIYDYYVYHNISLTKEVLAIANDYNKIFKPYRVVYDTKTRQQVLM